MTKATKWSSLSNESDEGRTFLVLWMVQVPSTLKARCECFREALQLARFHVGQIPKTDGSQADYSLLVLNDKSKPPTLIQTAQGFRELLDLPDCINAEGVT